MARAIDAWKAAFERGGKTVTVGGVVMHFDPLTSYDLSRAGAYDPKNDEERMVYLLIIKAKDAEGKQLFQVGDFHDLLHATPKAFLNEALEAMYASATVSPEGAAQALGESPASASATA